MAQLKMLWRRCEPASYSLPDGFSARTFIHCNEDIDAWIDICKNGLLDENADEGSFKSKMLDHPGLKTDDILLIERAGQGVATITAIVHPDNQGYVHMVAAKPESRGLGIGNAMNCLALKKLFNEGCQTVTLTTDEFRVPAIKSYLKAGFLPVEYDDGMKERWENLLNDLDISDVEMVDENGSTVRYLNNSNK